MKSNEKFSDRMLN